MTKKRAPTTVSADPRNLVPYAEAINLVLDAAFGATPTLAALRDPQPLMQRMELSDSERNEIAPFVGYGDEWVVYTHGTPPSRMARATAAQKKRINELVPRMAIGHKLKYGRFFRTLVVRVPAEHGRPGRSEWVWTCRDDDGSNVPTSAEIGTWLEAFHGVLFRMRGYEAFAALAPYKCINENEALLMTYEEWDEFSERGLWRTSDDASAWCAPFHPRAPGTSPVCFVRGVVDTYIAETYPAADDGERLEHAMLAALQNDPALPSKDLQALLAPTFKRVADMGPGWPPFVSQFKKRHGLQKSPRGRKAQ